MGAEVNFLPVNKNDMKERGWDELDIILVSGDAYVDHPAWASAILGRFLELHGYRVGIIAQPDWRSTHDFRQLGLPRLFFGISAGNLDSMVSHYTADKKKRRGDLYSPGGQDGYRPDRAVIVYSNRIKEAFPGIPIVIGGIEASLRRLAHYDYWSNKIRRSILLDSRADLLVYGMGEYPLLDIARRLAQGEDIRQIQDIQGTAYITDALPEDAMKLPSYEEIQESKHNFNLFTRQLFNNINPYSSPPLAQAHGNRLVIVNPPPLPLTTEQLDSIYQVPFQRSYHPMYEKEGGIPALIPVQFSLLTHRGCFGGCHFCSIGLHQGKFIQNRSIESLTREAQSFIKHPDFKGMIPDLGAASANMYGLSGLDQDKCRQCLRTSCLYPRVCKNLNTDHSSSIKLWSHMRKLQGINHIRVASGVRYDLVLEDLTDKYIYDLCRYHVGGQLKIAPEHVSPAVNRLMGKPGREKYERFMQKFNSANQKLGKKQYLIPYFISAHPGCGLDETVELAEFVRDNLQYYPEQTQNFTPTPMTLSTSMYYTGANPLNGRPVYIPDSSWERKAQRSLLQYRHPDNRAMALEALQKCGRSDLIGSSSKALLKGNSPPPHGKINKSKKSSKPDRK
ncbi:fe-s oxidoreductase [hydrocarbon metagenome]|uniref:Fe-s oxidoreductase n=1 Tax=hydrocarbon metagenome TaxID=938273 RepID=A0A0W8E2P1_9ZZZZ